jgi:hypothetical protein
VRRLTLRRAVWTTAAAVAAVVLWIVYRQGLFVPDRPFGDIRPPHHTATPLPPGPKHDPPRAGPTAAAAPLLNSRVRWTERRRKYENFEFAWLVENATTGPEEGSYTFANRALTTCLTVAHKGPEEKQAQEITQQTGQSTFVRDQRLAALHRLYSACRPLGSFSEMMKRKREISSQKAATGDALDSAVAEALHIASQRTPFEVRRKQMEKLLSLNDPEIASALRSALTATGATLDGVPIDAGERGLYAAAWDLAICANYGVCGGVDSLTATQSCWQLGECDYLDIWGIHYRHLLPWQRSRVEQLFLRVHANLSSGHYERFGPP